MLRKRLLLALSALVILLLGVGTAGLLLLRAASAEFDNKLQQSSRLMDAEKRLRVVTSTINSRYLAPLAYPFPEGGRVPDRGALDDGAQEMREALNVLKANENTPKVAETIVHLDRACQDYLNAWEEFFDNYPKTQLQRGAALQAMARFTQRITDYSEVAGILYSEQLVNTTRSMKARSVDSTLFVVSLMALGLVIAVGVYFHLARAIVDPVVSLAHSIKEIKKGNFELSLPEPLVNNELSSLIPSFNEMAAELRQRRREADDRFQRTSLLNRAVFTAIPTPVYVLNQDGNVDQLNPAAEVLQDRLGVTGRLPAALMGIFDDCVKQRRNYLPDDIREAALFRIDEEEHFFLPRIFRFSTNDGDGVSWAVVLMDVTRFRWLDDMKTNLLATVSHEIKTPLTGIRMVLHLLLEGRTGSLSVLQQSMVTSARDDCERLLLTLKRLLDLARVESGASQLKLSEVNLVTSAERVRSSLAELAGQRGCDIIIEAEADLPVISGDAVRLDEVLQNFLSNAIKYSPANRPIRIRLATVAGGKFVRLSVLDEGEGVPKEYEGRIFERFFRAPGQNSEGVGLGLSISREIVLAHEGRIGIADRNDGFTEFYADLPIDRGAGHD
jgi:NtrC-family two-component system sensor histidine kinase KinB